MPPEGSSERPAGYLLSAWTASHIAAIDLGASSEAPLIGERDVVRIAPEIDIWDAWPIQNDDGTPSKVAGRELLWLALAAPKHPDPEERHSVARIHLLAHGEKGWRHIGPAMPDGFSPGSREWAGSAVLKEDGQTLTLYFTAAGRRGERVLTFEQRLFQATATLVHAGGDWALVDWRRLHEMVVRDADHYMASDAGTGRVGTIKAFRDPGYFRDPADGTRHLFFTASLAGSESAYNGVVGMAVGAPGSEDGWRIAPPIVSADGVNNELERPHVIVHKGRYYLFWSTQKHVFNSAGPGGPTGLYGMVADRLAGPWSPLNGSGLVLANPTNAPRQAYSWLVMPDLRVTSFIDDWGRDAHEAGDRRFGATFAPTLKLELEGDRAVLARGEVRR